MRGSTWTAPHKGPSSKHPTGGDAYAAHRGSKGHSPGRRSTRDEAGGRDRHRSSRHTSPQRSSSPPRYRSHGTDRAGRSTRPDQAMPDRHRPAPGVSRYEPQQKAARGVDHGRNGLDAPPWRNPGEAAAVPGHHPAGRQVVRLDPHVTVRGGEVVRSVLCCARGARKPDILDADAAECNIQIQVPDDLSVAEIDDMIFGGPSVGHVSAYRTFHNPYPMLDAEYRAGLEDMYAVIIDNPPGVPLPDPWDPDGEDGAPEQAEVAPPPSFPPVVASAPDPSASLASLYPDRALRNRFGPRVRLEVENPAQGSRDVAKRELAGDTAIVNPVSPPESHDPSDFTTLAVMNIPGCVLAETSPTLSDVFAYLERRYLLDSIDFVYLYDCLQQPPGNQARLIIHAREPRDAVKLKKHLENWTVGAGATCPVVFRRGQGLLTLRNTHRKKHLLMLPGPPSSYEFRSCRGPVSIEFFADSSMATPVDLLEARCIYPRRTEPRVKSPKPPRRTEARGRSRGRSPTPPRKSSPARQSKRDRTTTAASAREAPRAKPPVKRGDTAPVKRPLTPVGSPPGPGAPDAALSKKPRRDPIVWTPQDDSPLRISPDKGPDAAGEKSRRNRGVRERHGSKDKVVTDGKTGVSNEVPPNEDATAPPSAPVLPGSAPVPDSGEDKLEPLFVQMTDNASRLLAIIEDRKKKPAMPSLQKAKRVSPATSVPQGKGIKPVLPELDKADRVGTPPSNQQNDGAKLSTNGFSTTPAACVDTTAEASGPVTDVVPTAMEAKAAATSVSTPAHEGKSGGGHLLSFVEDRRPVPRSGAGLPPVNEGPRRAPPTANGTAVSLPVIEDRRPLRPATIGLAVADLGAGPTLPVSVRAVEGHPRSLRTAAGAVVDGRQTEIATPAQPPPGEALPIGKGTDVSGAGLAISSGVRVGNRSRLGALLNIKRAAEGHGALGDINGGPAGKGSHRTGAGDAAAEGARTGNALLSVEQNGPDAASARLGDEFEGDFIALE
jgi:hypothetical protein